MLRILPDPVKHIIQPFRFLPGQIAHPGQQEILRFLLIHEPQLVRKELRGCEIIDHMPAAPAVCQPMIRDALTAIGPGAL